LNTPPTTQDENPLRPCTTPSYKEKEFPYAEPTGDMDFMRMD
jgi:hypothetical protein